MEHFKQELIEYLDYYNNRDGAVTSMACRLHYRQQALFGCLNNFCVEFLSNFFGALTLVLTGIKIPYFYYIYFIFCLITNRTHFLPL